MIFGYACGRTAPICRELVEAKNATPRRAAPFPRPTGLSGRVVFLSWWNGKEVDSRTRVAGPPHTAPGHAVARPCTLWAVVGVPPPASRPWRSRGRPWPRRANGQGAVPAGKLDAAGTTGGGAWARCRRCSGIPPEQPIAFRSPPVPAATPTPLRLGFLPWRKASRAPELRTFDRRQMLLRTSPDGLRLPVGYPKSTSEIVRVGSGVFFWPFFVLRRAP